ncbi:RNA-binding protein 39-like isoform X2 [Lineus longissimus]|uniref:RNA-binding protein 39-like isoform X2 n=1 Tax=Lineus longissimus TaxID=88925 RepID=UPI002B4D972C
MADDFDVEAMLEAPYRKEDDGRRSSEDRGGRDRDRGDRDRDRDRDRKRRSRSRDGDRKRAGSRERRRSRSRDRDRRRSRDRGDTRRRSRSRDRDINRDRRRRSRSRDRDFRRRSPPAWRNRGGRRSNSPPRGGTGPNKTGTWTLNMDKGLAARTDNELTPEERDARTVFIMQLAPKIRPRDLETFFSSVGKVQDVRIITDNKTRLSKGLAYVEFQDVSSVPLAMGLSGEKLHHQPILVMPSQAEKNRSGNPTNVMARDQTGPMRLYVGSLHFNITEEMLKGIFEPFGKIDHVNLVMDNESGRSKGFGFVTFHNCEDAKKALEQLNGFELAGRPMKCGHVTERTAEAHGASVLDSDEMDRAGIDLGATGRLQLMAKLAEGTGFQIPQNAANALNLNPGADGLSPSSQAAATTAPSSTSNSVAPPIATQCFMLSNMFNPATETNPTWDIEIRDDVIEECNKHGGVLHIYVDKASPQGNVYVKCPSIAAAVASVQALHGRWFAGKVITAAYVPLPNYHSLFPDTLTLRQLLLPSSQSTQTFHNQQMHQQMQQMQQIRM